MVLHHRKRRGESGALISAAAFCRKSTVMGFDQRLTNSQAQTKATQPSALPLFEGIENLWKGIGFDPHAAIGDFHPQLPIVVRGSNPEPAPCWSEFDRILDQ